MLESETLILHFRAVSGVVKSRGGRALAQTWSLVSGSHFSTGIGSCWTRTLCCQKDEQRRKRDTRGRERTGGWEFTRAQERAGYLMFLNNFSNSRYVLSIFRHFLLRYNSKLGVPPVYEKEPRNFSKLAPKKKKG